MSLSFSGHSPAFYPRSELRDRLEHDECPDVIEIAYYSENDLTLEMYLRQKCFDDESLDEICQHVKSYAHGTGRVSISVRRTQKKLTDDLEIVTWGCCRETGRQVTPVSKLSERSLQYSFGKFLENVFYNTTVFCRTWAENKLSHRHVTRFFALGSVVREPDDVFLVRCLMD